jgi:hypothetical protein
MSGTWAGTMSRDLALELLRLFRGSPHSRMARTLVWAGLAAIAAPWWLPILEALLARAGLDIGTRLTDAPWWASFGLALLLLAAAVLVFLRGEDAQRARRALNATAIAFPKGATFGSAARQIADLSNRTIAFRDFQPAELVQPLAQHRATFATCEQGLRTLRAMVAEGSIGPYRLIEEDGMIVLQREASP